MVPAGLQRRGWHWRIAPVISLVGGLSFAGGSSTAFAASAPTITQQPVSRNVYYSSDTTFSVTATGSGPLRYRWRFNGTNIPGATSATLALRGVVPEQAGAYQCQVSNSVGVVVSSNAALTVHSVVAWGRNDFDPTNVPPDLSNVVLIGAGSYGNDAVQADDTIVNWGTAQTPPPGLSNLVAVDPSGNFSVALQADGALKVWGRSVYGETDVPPGLTNCVSVSAGGFHGLAARADGTVAAWGLNSYGQTNVPPGLSNVVKVAGTLYHSLALKSDGKVAAWGWNAYGQCNVPAGLSNVIAIDGGYAHSVALKADGNLVIWGGNLYGEGIVPPGLSNVVAIACGDSHNIALKPDGTLISWGWNAYGQTNVLPGLSNVIAIAAGNAHNLVLLGKKQPEILRQPASVSAIAGTSPYFFVSARGRALRYQWRLNGTNLLGATKPILNLTGVQAANAGSYRVVVTNAFGAVTSAPTALTVLTPPTITLQPQPQSLLVGAAAGFSAAATGDAPLVYQWYFNGTTLSDAGIISGSTSPTLTINGVQPGHGGSYFVVVTNRHGQATSTVAALTVYGPPVITLQPPNADTFVHNSFSFVTESTGDGPLGYQWYFNSFPLSDGARISGTATPTLSIIDLQTNDIGFYQLVVTNHYGATTSRLARLNVMIPAYVVDPPRDVTVVAGSTARFTVLGGGDPPLSYRWQRNRSPLDESERFIGVFTSTLTISNVQSSDAGPYAVEVFGVGSETSADAILTVLTPPSFVVQPADQACAVGNALSLSATADGTAPIAFQWFFNGTMLASNGHITGALSSSLTISNAVLNDAGTYWVVVSNAAGLATSAVASVSIGFAPVITQQPVGQTNAIGTTTQFTVAATGDALLNYQWFLSDNAIGDDSRHSGTTTSGLTISNLFAADSGDYNVVVTNAYGSATSSVAPLLVLQAPAITVQPRGRSVAPGLPTSFSAFASGAVPLSYQWQLNGTTISGATSNNYAISAVSYAEVGDYRMIVGNAVGSVTSAVAQLTIGPVAIWGTYSFAANVFLWPPAGLSNVVAVAGGNGFSLALRSDGTVAVWGSGPVTNVPPEASNVVAITAGASHAVALRSDGSVVAWGTTSLGATNVPPGLSNVIAVAAGSSHSSALRSDGTVVAWLNGRSGQTNIPPGLMNVAAIDAGASQTLALREDGTVAGWGTSAGVFPAYLHNIVAVSAGPIHNLVLKTDGAVTAWGGFGSATNVPAGLNDVMAVEAAGGNDQTTGVSLVLRSNGLVFAWGGFNGGISNIPPGLSNAVAISGGFSHALALVNDGRPLILRPPVGGTFYAGQDLVLKAKAVGAEPLGYKWLKDGATIPGATAATLVLTGARFSDAGSYELVVSNALGIVQSMAVPVIVVDSAPQFFSQPASRFAYFGSPFTVGASVAGSGPLQLQWLRDGSPFADGTNQLVFDRALPQHGGSYQLIASNSFGLLTSSVAQVTFTRMAQWGGAPTLSNAPIDLGTVTAAAAGYDHVLALRNDGTVAAWGTGQDGATNVPPGLSNVVAVSAGTYLSVALRSDGTVEAWGANSSRQTNVPVDLNGVASVSAGSSHVLALRSNGTVAAWGLNLNGQTNVPAGLSNVVAIAAGLRHSLALQNDGTIVGWGVSGKIPSTTNVVAIAAGFDQSLALQADGTVAAWSATGAPTGLPGGLNNVVAIASGGPSPQQNTPFHNFALKSDGVLVGWGNNSYGQLNVPFDLVSAIGLSCGGSGTIALLGDRSPAVTVQSFGHRVRSGDDTALAVMAAGLPPGYQWRFNGADIPGATNNVLLLFGVARAAEGDYSVTISNALGQTSSRVVRLEVGDSQRLITVGTDSAGIFVLLSQDADGGLIAPPDLARFEAQASTNLVDWIILPGALSVTNGMLRLQDAAAFGHPSRFYRIVEH